jgi:hypothetical protein
MGTTASYTGAVIPTLLFEAVNPLYLFSELGDWKMGMRSGVDSRENQKGVQEALTEIFKFSFCISIWEIDG